MAGGAPKGNINGQKAKLWEGAIRRGLAKDRERLYRIAEKVLEAAEGGQPWAITEVRNTLDGKPKETVEVTRTDKRIGYAERIKKAETVPPPGPAEPLPVRTVQ